MHDTAATRRLFSSVPVVPVVVVEDVATAGPLARALVDAGLPLIEVTLRTPAALDAIRAMVAEAPEAMVGVGSVLDPAQLDAALAAGARFAVSPGATPRLLEAFDAASVPCLPGVATPGEAMAARELGFRTLKFFPAEAAGGVATLKAWSGPLADLAFCPTGGIDVQRAATYLGLPNVVCVGGSWITPPDLLRTGDFARIGQLARGALALSAARR